MMCGVILTRRMEERAEPLIIQIQRSTKLVTLTRAKLMCTLFSRT